MLAWRRCGSRRSLGPRFIRTTALAALPGPRRVGAYMGEPQEAGGAVSPGEDSPAGRADVILTPDQRVRVFISSTLEELAAERAAARRAVARLHLVPVWYES